MEGMFKGCITKVHTLATYARKNTKKVAPEAGALLIIRVFLGLL